MGIHPSICRWPGRHSVLPTSRPCHRPLVPALPTDRHGRGRLPESREERGDAVPFGTARTRAVPRPSGEWEASSSPPSTGFSRPPSTGLFRPAGCSERDGLELVLVEAASPSRCPVQAAPVTSPSWARRMERGSLVHPVARASAPAAAGLAERRLVMTLGGVTTRLEHDVVRVDRSGTKAGRDTGDCTIARCTAYACCARPRTSSRSTTGVSTDTALLKVRTGWTTERCRSG
jgi:hypothetical protein